MKGLVERQQTLILMPARLSRSSEFQGDSGGDGIHQSSPFAGSKSKIKNLVNSGKRMLLTLRILLNHHYVKSVRIGCYSGPNAGKYGPE